MNKGILPDTNVLGEIWNPAGRTSVREALADVSDRIMLSVVVLGETWRGISQLKPSRRRDGLSDYYAGLVRDFGDRILPVTLEVAEHWGTIAAGARGRGRTISPADGLIAATAVVHGLTVWTRNVSDFGETGASVFNPWED
ncbi:type II toxin-antitoxin system VapC family toxin [Amaricoccus sp.]|uniref:type II toxin-antitoxin system VapC family toxin n=1 Tax=Amaricoccus sp. TaxID=1872485 RepID=UPI001B46110A|nr:type II toxin-antitoxin system VapC family toxin [Amaricoccus sp.]MBP7001249.1 type II toxin-antitoxin system VapC family toxin [Amaricoccus sp.]